MVFYHHLNPVIFSFNLFGQPFDFRYYGLMYILGILFVWLFIRKYQKNFGLNLTKEEIADIVFYLTIGLLVGGRLGYILFYGLPYFLAHPAEIAAFWRGGMSFHGGFLLGVIILYFYCRRKKLDFLKVGDLIAVPLPIALAFGRLGNFINGELWGKAWDGPWAFIFPGAADPITGLNPPRHPSQLYEILKNLTIFSTLLSLKRFKPKKGTLFFSFFTLYGIFRIIIELFRAPDVGVPVPLGISMGQWLSIPMVIFGIGGLIWIHKRKEKDHKQPEMKESVKKYPKKNKKR